MIAAFFAAVIGLGHGGGEVVVNQLDLFARYANGVTGEIRTVAVEAPNGVVAVRYPDLIVTREKISSAYNYRKVRIDFNAINFCRIFPLFDKNCAREVDVFLYYPGFSRQHSLSKSHTGVTSAQPLNSAPKFIVKIKSRFREAIIIHNTNSWRFSNILEQYLDFNRYIIFIYYKVAGGLHFNRNPGAVVFRYCSPSGFKRLLGDDDLLAKPLFLLNRALALFSEGFSGENKGAVISARAGAGLQPSGPRIEHGEQKADEAKGVDNSLPSGGIGRYKSRFPFNVWGFALLILGCACGAWYGHALGRRDFSGDEPGLPDEGE